MTLVHCNIVKYADDTVLFISHQDVDVVEKLLNKDFYNICHWLEENELIIITSKKVKRNSWYLAPKND